MEKVPWNSINKKQIGLAKAKIKNHLPSPIMGVTGDALYVTWYKSLHAAWYIICNDNKNNNNHFHWNKITIYKWQNNNNNNNTDGLVNRMAGNLNQAHRVARLIDITLEILYITAIIYNFCLIIQLVLFKIIYPEWPHRQCVAWHSEGRTFAAHRWQQVFWFAARISLCNTWSSGVLPCVGWGVRPVNWIYRLWRHCP